jgi:hypothetical protein
MRVLVVTRHHAPSDSEFGKIFFENLCGTVDFHSKVCYNLICNQVAATHRRSAFAVCGCFPVRAERGQLQTKQGNSHAACSQR